jgi:hypothetical protein
MVFPDLFKILIGRCEFVMSQYPSADLSIPVRDQHPVALELPADQGTHRVHGANKPFPVIIFSHEGTPLGVRLILALISKRINKIRLYVDEKQFVGDPIPAVIIPVSEFPLNFDELTKTLTALPTGVTVELNHTSK